MRAVIYEDNLFFLASLDARLRALGHDVQAAASAEVVRTLNPADCDLLIVDLHAADAFGEIERFGASIPVVAFCGHAEVELRKRAKAAGVDYLLPNSEIVQALPAVLAKIQMSAPA